MQVSCKESVLPVSQKVLYGENAIRGAFPRGWVQKYKSPSNIRVLAQYIPDIRDLLRWKLNRLTQCGNHRLVLHEVFQHLSRLGGVFDLALMPHFTHQLVTHVVITHGSEKGHLQLIDHAVEFVPLLVEFTLIITVSLDGVADVDDELGLQQIELIDCSGKTPCASAPPVRSPITAN